MKPIYKFNSGLGATLCHLCRTVITIGKPTNDLYCDQCLNERNHTEKEFNLLKAKLKRKQIFAYGLAKLPNIKLY